MRCIKAIMVDDNFNALGQLPNLKAQKEAVAFEKEAIVNAMEEARDKVEQLLNYKVELKKLNQQVENDLTKLRVAVSNLEAHRDAVVSERVCLSRDLNTMMAKKQRAESEVFGKAQKEYIDHLAFLLELHMDKLATEVISEMWVLHGE